MFSLFKRKRPKIKVPQWASFLTPDQYEAFMAAIRAYFSEINLGFREIDGVLEADPNDRGLSNLGLQNLAQICRQLDQKEYLEVVRGHFNSLSQGDAFNVEFEQVLQDFDKVKKYLALRLYPQDILETLGRENAIGKDFAEGLFAMLVFDLPTTVRNVKPEELAPWNLSEAELFAIGIRNVKYNYPFSIEHHQLEGFGCWFVSGDHFFVPNIVFDLQSYPQFLGANGAIIAIPHRHGAIIYPIENLELIQAMHGFMHMAQGMFQEGPGSLTDRVYWFHDGTFENLDYDISNEGINFRPSEAFVKMLGTLSN